MKNKAAPIVKVICFCVLIQFGSIKGFSQCERCNLPDIIPLPKMFVSKALTTQRINAFKNRMGRDKSKFEIFQNISSSQSNTFFIPSSSFNKLLGFIGKKGVRIYFASYNSSNSPANINLKEKQVVLLFSPVNSSNEGFSTTYLVDNSKNVIPIDESFTNVWIKDYEKLYLPELNTTINLDDPENHPDCNPSVLSSDTRSVYYPAINIDEAFRLELAYQLTHNRFVRMVGFQVTFSSYDENGRPRDLNECPANTETNLYKRRMIIQFDYMIKPLLSSRRIFYIDDQPDFECRLRCKNGIAFSEDKIEQEKAVDNGHLCPANCPVSAPPIKLQQ